MKAKSNKWLMLKVLTAVLLPMMFVPTANAQYYPSAYPVPPQKLNQLLINLTKIKNDNQRIPLLLSLGNLYFNKPIRKDNELEQALYYAKQAKQLSMASNNLQGFNQSQALIADILSDKTQFDAAEKILVTVNDTTKLNLLLMLGFKYYLNAPDVTSKIYKQCLQNCNEAKALALKLHDKGKELWAKTLFAYFYTYLKPKEAEERFNDLIREYTLLKRSYSPYMYYFLTRFYSITAHYDKALATILPGIEAMRMHKDTLLLGDCFCITAGIYSGDGQHLKSIGCCDQALAQFKIHSGEFDFFTVVNLKKSELQHLKRHKEALTFLLKSIKDYPPKNKEEQNGYMFQTGKCYEELGNYKMAEKYLVIAYNGLKKNNTLGPNDKREMAEFYVRQKKYEQARPYVEEFFKYKATLGMGIVGHAEYMAYLIDSAAGNYKSAMAHLAKNKFLDNQMLTDKKNQAIAELSVKYETAKKDGKINLLTQKAKYEAANFRQANQVRNLLGAGIILVLIIAGLLLRQNRQKQKSNEIVTHKNELLQRLVEEKEWLLKEVHHRVKNNLHTVICLLESQAAYLENDALMAIENSQHRIYAMSLIHQKLYQTDAIETIDMPAYIKDFLNYLKDAFGQTDRIQIHADVESFSLGAAQAIPLGLIINEAVTNAYKYAFPANRKGIINISLHQSADLVELLIIDNGIGMKVLDEFEDSPSLGMQLIKGLTRDLKGQLKIDGSKGTSIRILFEINIFDKPVSGLNIAVPG